MQGVGYRFFAQEAAAIEGLSGWVRNLPDGGVEVFAEGEAAAVDRFASQLARGPGRARVESIQVFDESPGASIGRFVVRM